MSVTIYDNKKAIGQIDNGVYRTLDVEFNPKSDKPYGCIQVWPPLSKWQRFKYRLSKLIKKVWRM